MCLRGPGGVGSDTELRITTKRQGATTFQKATVAALINNLPFNMTLMGDGDECDGPISGSMKFCECPLAMSYFKCRGCLV